MGMVLAPIIVCAAEGTAAPDSEDQRRSDAPLEEIIVTAQKRIERLLDVPVPVSVISGETLVVENQLRLQDFYTKIPGFSFVLSGSDRAVPAVAIRGVTTGGNATPTVGFVVDDVPYGASTVNAGSYVPHIDPSDLARIEVLRGPQGTLYGASSLGGLVKYVTVDPSTDAFSGQVEGGLLSVKGGSDLGYNVRAAVNVPITDSFALRASGFDGRDPGYVDNVATGEWDVNQQDRRGGRLSALWQPSESLSLKVNALYQDTESRGSSSVSLEPGIGELQQRRLRGTGVYDQEAKVGSAILNARIGSATLTALTGYSVKENLSTLDASSIAFFSTFAQGLYGVAGVQLPEKSTTRKFSQELRVALPITSRIDWLLGGFYTEERIKVLGGDEAVDPANGAIVGRFYNIDVPTRYEEYAAFTNLTVRMTDRFDIQIGGRASEDRQTFSSVLSGALLGGLTLVTPDTRSQGNALTYLVTPRFKVSPDLVLYARLASGYRPGGPNASCNPTNTIPCDFDADETQNYELGVKADLFDRRLTFDASVYYIQWRDIQLSLTDENLFLGYNANAGRAKSQGVELSVDTRPLAGLRLSAWVAYNDAKLTEDPPAGVGAFVASSGDRLPFSGRFSGNVSLDEEFLVGAHTTGFIGATVSYVDDRPGNFPGFFATSTQRQIFPAYWQTDLRGGLRRDSWALNVFINNVADRRGVLSGGTEKLNPFYFDFIQPRTVGMSLVRSF
jgi:outer membrane receptor protein involved in Fe transport